MLHKHDPIPEEAMQVISPRNSICETIRQAYHLTDNPEAKLKLREATAMAKAMSAKLSEGKKNWFWNFWDKNPAYWSKMPERLKRPIDVLFIAYDDYANTGYRFWMCAKHLGLNSLMVKGKHHDFNYPNQAPLHPSLMHAPISKAPMTVMAPDLEYLIESANVIHLIASTYPMCAAKWNKHPVIVQHGGTVYRQMSKEVNEFFNPIVQNTIVQCPDLLGLGSKNESLIYYPVDTYSLRPDFSKKGDKLVVGHFPSNPTVKGSDTIYEVVNGLIESGYPIEYKGYNPNKKPWYLYSWEQNLKRMGECDVIVETHSIEQTGKVFGEWGNTALEASALGCVIVSNCIHQDTYEKEYGQLGIHVANDTDTLRNELIRLSGLSVDALTVEKRECFEWADTNHSIPATAQRLWDKVYSRYF